MIEPSKGLSIQLEIFAYTYSCTNNKTDDSKIKYLYIY